MPHLSTDNRGGYGSLSKLAGPTSRLRSARRRIGRDRDSRPWPQLWSRPQERQHSDLMSHTRDALTHTMHPARTMDCPPLMSSPRATSLIERRRARRERKTCQLTRPCRPRGPPDRAKLCRPFEAQLGARAGAAAARFANALGERRKRRMWLRRVRLRCRGRLQRTRCCRRSCALVHNTANDYTIRPFEWHNAARALRHLHG